MADILLGDKRYYGVTHIGTRPTLDNDSFVSIETYIFDFDKDIYGCTITVNLYKKLREVRKCVRRSAKSARPAKLSSGSA